MLDSWRFLQREAGFQLYGYVILAYHLHLIATSVDLSRNMQRFKSYTAKQIIEHLEQCRLTKLLELLASFKSAHKEDTIYQVWEEGNHPQIIEFETVMRQKLDYIHWNPVKRGYIDQPEHWRYSSPRNYAGQQGLIEVIRDW
ncbi:MULTISPECIES: transposase [Methylobacter]